MSSDLPPFGSGRLPGSAPRADVLDAVVRDGRRRLRRSGALSGSAVLVAGILAGASLVAGGKHDALEVVPASPGPVPSADGAAGPVPPGRGASSLPGAGLVSPSSAPRSRAPGAIATRGPGGAAPPRVVHVTPYRESPDVEYGAESCPVDRVLTEGSPPGTQLCLTAGKNGRTVRSGDTFLIEVDLCNALSSANAARLTYATGREHDVSLERDGSVPWSWSRHHTFPQGAHSRQLERGTCLAWKTPWDTRDDSGRLVQPGTYDVVMSVDVNGETESLGMSLDVTP